MKSEKSIVRLAVILLVVLAAAAVLYSVLSSRYAPTVVAPASTAVAATMDPASLPTASDFAMEDADGNALRLADFLGEKPAIVNFWASWCPPCKAELPDFDAAYAEYGEEVAFLMVNLTDGARETKATANAFLSDAGYTFPVYYDTMGQAVSAYSLYSIPVTLAITADGKLAAQRVGAISDEVLQEMIESLLTP